jgi:hypothetical protein
VKKTYTRIKDPIIEFEIIVDELLHNIFDEIKPKNKALLSIVNKFEDGNWRLKKFEQFIWNNIKETALSKEERDSLIDDADTTLYNSVINLRLLDGEEAGGEIGEILLHGIMKKYYSALPVIPKIFYKQNSNDYAKGADSVHIVIDDNLAFSLWLGEAKFYNSLDNNRLDKILDSISSMLSTEKLRKEMTLLTSLKDIELFITDKTLLKEIKDSFSDGISMDEIKQKLHIPIMLLHECDITADNTQSMRKYVEVIKEKHLDITNRFIKKLDKKLEKLFAYTEIKFHIIIFPVPNKLEIVKRFKKKANVIKS